MRSNSKRNCYGRNGQETGGIPYPLTPLREITNMPWVCNDCGINFHSIQSVKESVASISSKNNYFAIEAFQDDGLTAVVLLSIYARQLFFLR
jgi:hypothetical protein